MFRYIVLFLFFRHSSYRNVASTLPVFCFSVSLIFLKTHSLFSIFWLISFPYFLSLAPLSVIPIFPWTPCDF